MSEEKPEVRSYSSPLRSRQQESTRRVIMEAVAHLVAEGRIHTFSVQDVAERAGISYASVYRHFPTREALLEGMYEWASAMTAAEMPSAPQTLDGIPTWLEASIPVFEQHAVVSQAVLTLLSAANINPESQRRRDETIDGVIADSVPHLPLEFARRAGAVVRYLAGSQGWATLRRRFGLSSEDTTAALTWALGVLIREINQCEAAAAVDRSGKGAE